jgi:murein DD-endopeptidase MepM/ murein hydrolase activator NlpD
MSTASQESIDEMVAAKESLNRFITELEELDSELQALEAEATLVMDARQEAADKEQAAFKKLNSECQKLQRQYQAQVAAELARKRAAQTAGYKGPGNIPGFICPFPGSSFVDSWGAPRSGGRKHKGTDLMGPWNGRIYAVTSGTVITRTGGLGGNAIWLEGGGYGYYYAHLSSFNVRNGQYVNKGDLIGFNGDTGNAKGGYPHLHFEIHPGGKSYSAVNPYPALVQVCR